MKKWLQQNKIYFETAAATLLSIMAVLVSVAQLSVTSKQNELVEAQLRVAKATIEPIISIQAVLEADAERAVHSTSTLKIQNIGAPAFEAKVHVLTFLKVRLQPDEANPREKAVTIRILDYFDTTFVTQARQGIIFTVTGRHNYSRLIELENSILEGIPESERYLGFELEHFIAVSFRDSMGDTATKYYRVDQFGAAQMLAEDEGNNRFEQSEKVSFGPASQSMNKLEKHGLREEVEKLKSDT